MVSQHMHFRGLLRHQLTLGPSEEAGFLGLAAMGPWGQGVSAFSIQATVGMNGEPEEGAEHHGIHREGQAGVGQGGSDTVVCPQKVPDTLEAVLTESRGFIPPPHLSHGLLALTHDGSSACQKPERRFLTTTQKRVLDDGQLLPPDARWSLHCLFIHEVIGIQHRILHLGGVVESPEGHLNQDAE